MVDFVMNIINKSIRPTIMWEEVVLLLEYWIITEKVWILLRFSIFQNWLLFAF